MRDLHQRTINYLRLSVTDRCNCRCQYCMPASHASFAAASELLTPSEFQAIVQASAELGVTKIRLTGGEPLVRPDLPEIVERIAQTPGITEVCLTTNATLLAPQAATLKAAGLNRVNVSLDTLDPLRYQAITRTGTLAQALEGIDAALEAGLTPIKINCVLMGGVNEQDIRPLALLAKDRPISVRFIELMPIGEAATWPHERFIPVERVLEELPEMKPLPHRASDGVASRYKADGWQGGLGLIHPISHRFCAECNRIRVTADGMLKPCLHSAEEIPLKGLESSALKAALAQGILAKPERHMLEREHKSQSARPMSRIGG